MSVTSTEIVFPIGHYAGHRRDLDGVHQVRRGWLPQKLSADEFTVWVMSHGSGSAAGSGDWSTTDVLDLARRAKVADPGPAVDALKQRGLLATVPRGDAGREEVEEFARNHRMNSLLTGLGDTEENHGVYAVGVPDAAATVWLDAESYETWVWAPLSPTLWSFAEARARMLGELGQPTEPVDVLAGLLRQLRVLLSNSCAYLDLAFSRARAESVNASR